MPVTCQCVHRLSSYSSCWKCTSSRSGHGHNAVGKSNAQTLPVTNTGMCPSEHQRWTQVKTPWATCRSPSRHCLALAAAHSRHCLALAADSCLQPGRGNGGRETFASWPSVMTAGQDHCRRPERWLLTSWKQPVQCSLPGHSAFYVAAAPRFTCACTLNQPAASGCMVAASGLECVLCTCDVAPLMLNPTGSSA